MSKTITSKIITDNFDQWCRDYEKKNPGFLYRKFRPSPLWPILFQKGINGKFITIAQTEAPQPRETSRLFWRT